MVYSLKSEEIEKFISSDVIDLMGLSDLPDEDKKNMREKIIRTIENRALARIAAMLKDKGKTAELEGIEEEEGGWMERRGRRGRERNIFHENSIRRIAGIGGTITENEKERERKDG